MNDDGVVNVLDVSLVAGCAEDGSRAICELADATGDGTVDVEDREAVITAVGQTGFPVHPAVTARRQLCEQQDAVAADDTLRAFLSGPDAAAIQYHFQTAKFVRAVTRLIRAVSREGQAGTPEVDTVPEGLDAAGFSSEGRNALSWSASSPLDPLITQIFFVLSLPEILDILQGDLRPRLDESIEDLLAVDADFETSCELTRLGERLRVELDHSDALLFRAVLLAARAQILLSTAYDLDADVGLILLRLAAGASAESLLADPAFAELFTPSLDTSGAAQARSDAASAIQLLQQGVDAVLAETDDQADDLASLVHFTPEARQQFLDESNALLAALEGPTLLPQLQLCGDGRVHAGRLFEAPDLRALFPPFTGNRPDVRGIPDPTLAGILPGQTAADLACVLDDEGPELVERPEELVPTPSELRLRFVDPPLGASPGQPADPASLRVEMAIFSFAFGGDCSATINGQAALADDGVLRDVTALLGHSLNPDGSLDVGGSIAVTASGEACQIQGVTTVADTFGNVVHDSFFFNVARTGAFVTFSPRIGARVTSPFGLEIDVSAPYGDVDASAQQVRLSGFGCGEVRLNGTLVPESAADPFFFFNSNVSESLTRTGGASAATFAAVVEVAAPPCTLELAVTRNFPESDFLFVPSTRYGVDTP